MLLLGKAVSEVRMENDALLSRPNLPLGLLESSVLGRRYPCRIPCEAPSLPAPSLPALTRSDAVTLTMTFINISAH